MKKKAFQEIRLVDYKPPVFLIDRTELDFRLDEKRTRVKSKLFTRRNPDSKEKSAPLFLNGEDIKLISVRLDGKKLDRKKYKLTDKGLTIPSLPDEALIEIENENAPAKNLELSGLYKAGPMLCTQCESEGFRRITFYADRPDVQSSFRVTIHADKKKYPILLSNGNLIKKGSEGKTRHYAVWEDPFRKPCYLFALVAGQMDRRADFFTTRSGRKVLIEIYTEPGKEGETGFALDAIKKAMRWDEKRFGREYDLDRFMMVAVSFFNYGAMENKGLNVFNDTCVLGRAETATDDDITFFERVVGHEYFHNWTGDRVTCRDWFQLSLKEGLTVFREEEFCGDMNSRVLERIHAASTLRRVQFAEDASAMAHPVRPPAYKAIDNFYTATVYHKGAEIVRMIQTLVGRKGFRKGMDLYFKRHDGHSATCEDFVASTADANGIDLSQFMLWYSQAGTPTLKVRGTYNAKKREYVLRVRQSTKPTPGQKTKKPLYMPFALGLLDEKGRDMKGTFVIDLSAREETLVFLNVPKKPVPSLLRDFSAPVRVDYPYTDNELLLLMAHDSDSFNRWDAGQKLLTKYVLSGKKLPPKMLGAMARILEDKKLDAGTKAAMLSLPSESELGLELTARGKKIDPVKLYRQRQKTIKKIAVGLSDLLWKTYEGLEKTLDPRAADGPARGKRSLKHLCLAYLMKIEPETALPLACAEATLSPNMTDKTVGLELLAETNSELKDKALVRFEKKYENDPAIMDNWFSAQAAARREDVLASVKRLTKHPVFDLKNPNRISALIGVFAGNPIGFHAMDGSGYAFVADMVLAIDKQNAITAARYVKPFLRWRDFDAKRQKLMRTQLKRLGGQKKLSVSVRELVDKALK